MTTTPDTALTIAQSSRLSDIAIGDPGAKVVGWDDRAHGPLVLRSDGSRRAINPRGRLVPRAHLEDAEDTEMAA